MASPVFLAAAKVAARGSVRAAFDAILSAVMGVVVCERVGVPAFCVPLLRAGCSDTDVDLDDVRSALEAIVT